MALPGEVSVRPALEADLLRVFEMGVSFIVSAPDYAGVIGWTPEGIEDLTRFLSLEAPHTVLVLEDGADLVGMIGLALSPNLFGGEKPIAEEVAWWVDPPYRDGRGLKLLDAAEEWARRSGAVVLTMVAPWGSRIGVIYQRRGYRPLETRYILRL